MRTLHLIIVALLLTAIPAAAVDGYEIIGSTSSQVANRVRTEFTVQAGDSALDQFKMIRLVKRIPAANLRGSIIFLPALGPSFTFYEQRDVGDIVGTSIAEYFAKRNFDVYGYTPRYDGIPAGACEAGLLDCSVMATWDIQSMVDDVTFIRSQIALLNPGSPVVIAGHALGAEVAIATVNAHPDDYAGLVMWEGLLAVTDPEARALNQAYCEAYEGLMSAGIFFDGVSMNVFKQAVHFADLYPKNLTPNPLFPPFLTNHQALVAALCIPDPTQPITMIVPTYVLMRGSLEEDRFFYASEARGLEIGRSLADYYPLALVRDLVCSIAGLDDQHVANLGSFTAPVLAIGGGRGYGPYMQEQLDLFGSTEITFLLTPDFGLFDHFASPNHRRYVERPIRDWLLEVFP